MTNTNKITLLLCGDFRFDENKNKFILQSSINYVKIFSGPFSNKILLISQRCD